MVVLGYTGLDGQTRRTRVSLRTGPGDARRPRRRASISQLAPQAEHSFLITVACESEWPAADRLVLERAHAARQTRSPIVAPSTAKS